MHSFLFNFLFFLVFFTSVFANDCRVDPPYRQISVVTLHIDTNHPIWTKLAQLCELRYIDDDAGHRGPVLLTPVQLKLARQLLPFTDIKLLISDLATHLSDVQTAAVATFEESELIAAPTNPPNTAYTAILRGPSRPLSAHIRPPYLALDESFHTMLRPLHSHEKRWKKIGKTYSRTTRLEIIGKTTENRNIHMFRIGTTSIHAPNRVLILFGQHAREWATVASAAYVAEVLASSPTHGVEILLIPLVNPDGYHYSMVHDRLWRKNRSKTSRCRAGLIHSGVDLNRNWGVDFGGPHTTDPDPCSPIHHGPSAFSEPETAAIRRLNITGLRAFLDVHSYSQLLVGPWACCTRAPPRAADVDIIGRRLEMAASAGGSPYSYGRGKKNGIYLASGVASDWFFKQGALASFTLELRPDRYDPMGFEIMPEQILPTARDALNVVRELIAFAKGNTTLNRDSTASATLGGIPNNNTPGTRPAWIIPVAVAGVVTLITILIVISTMIVIRKRNENANESSTTPTTTTV